MFEKGFHVIFSQDVIDALLTIGNHGAYFHGFAVEPYGGYHTGILRVQTCIHGRTGGNGCGGYDGKNVGEMDTVLFACGALDDVPEVRQRCQVVLNNIFFQPMEFYDNNLWRIMTGCKYFVSSDNRLEDQKQDQNEESHPLYVQHTRHIASNRRRVQ